MPYRRTGRSGLDLPAISLGLWQNFGGTDVFETGRAMLRQAFDRGVTHFDLANNYGPPYGSAEENFGRVLATDFRNHRDELVISTKAGWDMWPGPYGCLGAPLKYLNFNPAGPYHFAASSIDAQQQLWARVMQTRTSPNGVFGLKAFLMQFHELQQSNPRLLASVLAELLPKDRPKPIVYLRRRDKVAQAVSYARAAKSGVWRKEQESERSSWIDYSREEIEAAGRGIVAQEERWEQMFSDLRIQPLRIWHEDTLKDPAAAARQVASYLDVVIDPRQVLDVPAVLKQSEGNSAAWIQGYLRASRPPAR